MEQQQYTGDEEVYTLTGGPLRAHEYVLIKEVMTAADRAWINNHASKVTGDARNPQMAFMAGDVELAKVKRMIVGWHRTREHKQSKQQEPIPFTAAEVEKMPDRLFSFVKQAIDRLNPENVESDAAFLPAAAASSETRS